MKVLITGGTGFVGRRLIAKLDHCIVTTRDAALARQRLGEAIDGTIEWKSSTQPLQLSPLTKLSAVVNLMGESIAEGRWNDAKKKMIRSSRVDATNRLVESILKLNSLPEVVVSASAVGIYGDCGEDVVTEDRGPGEGFLADVCVDWEQATQPLTDAGIRVVTLRIGIVLGAEGGALAKLIPIFKVGAGGRLGSGRQYVPWIHIDDLVALILWSINTPTVSGPINATSPNPVRNLEMTSVLARAVKRPAIFPVPTFGLKLAVGEFADSLMASQQVVPNVALAAGFQFQYPNIDLAIQDIVQS